MITMASQAASCHSKGRCGEVGTLEVALIGADLSPTSLCWLGTVALQPGTLFRLTMASLAFATAHVALQSLLALLETPMGPGSAQHRAHLLATKVRQRPVTSNPLSCLRLLDALCLLTHVWEVIGQRHKRARQHLAHPVGFLLLQPPTDEIQLHHATDARKVLQPQLME